MNVILLGLGQQGRAALYDLIHLSRFEHIIAVDLNPVSVRWANAQFSDPRLVTLEGDASDTGWLNQLLRAHGPGIVIDLLPIQFIPQVARAAVSAGWHYVNTYYTLDAVRELGHIAETNGISILPEFGLDPGIDLVMAGGALRTFDRVYEFYSYGAGIPEPRACTNPLNYKVSWIMEGVLNSYYRTASLIVDGQTIRIDPDEIFAPRWIKSVDVDGLGTLEAYPNGDVTPYVDLAGLGFVRNAGRYAMRWPGHSQFWYTIAQLGLLEDKTVELNGVPVPQRKVLAQLLAPRLQYRDDERDITLLLVEIAGEREGRPCRATYQMIDYRDLETGFMSMNRTVGFTASIGAQMLHRGVICQRGLLSPLRDVPYGAFATELARRNIHITCKEQ